MQASCVVCACEIGDELFAVSKVAVSASVASFTPVLRQRLDRDGALLTGCATVSDRAEARVRQAAATINARSAVLAFVVLTLIDVDVALRSLVTFVTYALVALALAARTSTVRAAACALATEALDVVNCLLL
jgi:hypothetical protein